MPAPLPPSRKQAPLSPMSSPQQSANASLPAPPSLPRRTSSRSARLHLPHSQAEPPVPPRLVGSPLLNNLINSKQQQSNQGRTQQEVWIDGDEFGTHRARLAAAPVPDIARGSARYTSPPPQPMPGAKFAVASYGSSRGVPA